MNSTCSFIDSHAHLTMPDLFCDLHEVLKRAQAMHVTRIINVCTDHESLQRALEMRHAIPWVSHAAATHPHDVAMDDPFLPLVAQRAQERQLVAIGETGLDYHHTSENKALQQCSLGCYCDLARKTQLPLIIHCRDAFEDLFALMDGEGPGAAVVLHCFTGTLAQAKQVLDRGWLLSLSGIVTFKKSEALREVAAYVPIHRLLVETDAPYLAPQSRRGHRNEPSFITETVACIAQCKGINPMDLASAISENARAFFSL